MTDNQTTITMHGEVYTFRLLWRVVERQLQNATSNPGGSISDLMAALTFAAFTVEAYVNFVGLQLHSDTWLDKYERKPINCKMEKIFSSLDLTWETFGRETRTTIEDLKKITR